MAGHTASCWGGPPPPAESARLRCAHRPVSSSPSNSERTVAPSPTEEVLKGCLLYTSDAADDM
eukprot:5505545-Alexandrium_andersonii.AAC.1